MTDTTTTTTTTETAPKRGPGRPKGARNRPKPTPRAAGAAKPSPPDGPVSPDDAAAQSVADKLAAAAVPPRPDSLGGRPTVRQNARAALSEQLAVSYTAAGAMIEVAGVALTLNPSTRATGERIRAVGVELGRNADKCGEALAHWADTNPRVKAWLSRVSTGSGALMVLAAHAPILAAAFGSSPAVGEMIGDVLGGPADETADAMREAMGFASMFATMFTGATGDPAVPVDPSAPVSDPVV